MKHMKKIFIIMMAAVLFVTGSGVLAAEGKNTAGGKDLSVAFTHDIHSHLDSFYTYFEGEETEIGGLPRMSTLIQQQRQLDEDLLLIDGGDFSMGTLYQMLYATEASELRMLGYLGYDATTIGNHEFDYGSGGLADMFCRAADSGDNLPAFLLCNVDWTEPLDEEQMLLKEAFDRYGVQDYTVVTKGDVRVALIGVMGVDALACAPTCALKFEDPVEAVKETVQEIQANENVDIIVCLSHSGVTSDPDSSEDEILAREVPELDLILSGHTHTRLDETIVCGDTTIVSCGEYGEMLGTLKMEQNETGRWSLTAYELIPVTSDVAEDEAVLAELERYDAMIDEQLMEEYGFATDTVLAKNPYLFVPSEDVYEVNQEYSLTNLIADAFYYGAEVLSAEGTDVAASFVPSGCVRDTLACGEITVAEVFESYSLGIGPDGRMGYPLIGVYLSGKELKDVAEIDVSISDFMKSARIYASGMAYEYNPNRFILNRITDVKLVEQGSVAYMSPNAAYQEIDPDQLYYVVADLYTGQMLSAVESLSMGLLSITPKDASGDPIENLEEHILYDAAGNEIKAWTAIVNYIQTVEDETGKAEIPAYYNELHGRKTVDDSRNIIDLLKNPSRYFVLFTLVAVIVIVVVVLVIRLVVKKIKRIRARKSQKNNDKKE